MEIQFGTETVDVQEINPKRKYWFVRTYGGKLYEEFLSNDYVGIGFNKVPYEYISNASSKKDSSFDKLVSFIDLNSKYKGAEAKKWAKQLISFQSIVDIGDVVIIPSAGSKKFSIGTVQSKMSVRDTKRKFFDGEKQEDLPEKIRKINWQRKNLTREDFQTDLRNLLSSHRVITNADSFFEYIEGQLTPVFVKENKAYLMISIGQDEAINAFEFNRFLSGLTYFYTEFCKEEGIEPNEDLDIKIKVQSKGKVLLYGAAIAGIVGLFGLMSLPKGAGIEAKIEKDKSGSLALTSGEGLLEAISKFMDKNEERRQNAIKFNLSVERLKAQPGNDSLQTQENKVDDIKKEGEENNRQNKRQETKKIAK
jgi:restriction system protein